MVAYDGSPAAAKALHVAELLGIFGSAGAHVVSVARARSEALDTAGRATEFLQLHGVRVDVDAVSTPDHPADILLRRSSEIGASMLVMGAFGHRGFREILTPSDVGSRA